MKRVLFLGGKSIGCRCFEYLLTVEGIQIIGAFVNPGDDAPGRRYPSLGELAKDAGIPVYTTNINQEVATLIGNLQPHLIVVVYYDRILKREVINVPPMGCINLHFALAEKYRGCYPTTWAIIDGQDHTGVTIHYINEGIDSGDIISQKRIDITPSETGVSLYKKCTQDGVRLFRETFPKILDETAARRPQEYTYRTQSHSRQFPDQRIIVSQQVANKIRGLYFPPFPLPYILIGSKKFVIVEEKYVSIPETTNF